MEHQKKVLESRKKFNEGKKQATDGGAHNVGGRWYPNVHGVTEQEIDAIEDLPPEDAKVWFKGQIKTCDEAITDEN